MSALNRYLNRTVTAFLLTVMISLPAHADSARVDDLLDQLGQQGLPNWQVVEEDLRLEWSKSGSPAMDLLFQRGYDAMEAGDFALAVEHFTALTDHAPDFAEGFNARATAYFNLGLYGPAFEDVARTLALNPRHFGALTGLGAMFEDMEQPARALAAYRSAHAIHPNEPTLQSAIERLERDTSGTTL